ncbi:MAG TPA: lipoate--protein ligase family protein [Gemmataceae bacterium]|nr:lipoate--protein ligase family protein [Gemmataceae bacterium]
MSGPANMAADESLLRSALERNVATLRFYTWTEPTLSLGYFQAHTDRLLDPRLGAVAFVRRHTGGAAILHHREITYALTLPAGSPWHTAESWICRFHHAVTAALCQFGAKARSIVCGEEKKLGPCLCFLHHTPGDLLVEGHKVVGSAQRRPHGALLQHGSILLRRSEYAPDLPGIEDLSGFTVPGPALQEMIVAELNTATGWTFAPGDWTDDERRHAARLEREKYGTAAWNTKR